MFRSIKKRDGREVEFEASKITAAIAKAGRATGEFGEETAHMLMLKVLSIAERAIDGVPTVEA
ncbi:MAG TPA: ATP cone domain-containing protein, partial [Deltaproteobacteria bacterium]|nr:ATP cone domain-containing protein [Deltaproteobacteria bacterium]